jgi:hypothetical protein
MRLSPFRTSPLDALLLALAVAQGGLLCALLRAATVQPAGPVWAWAWAAPLLGVGLWWNANTISHNHIHCPLFRRRLWNRAFSLYLSVLSGVPQTLWRERHLWHHAGEPARRRVRRLGAFGWLEVALVALLFGGMLVLLPAAFLCVYLPGYLIGLGLCQAQGHHEHRGLPVRAEPGVSYYGALYNLLWFNDGYHAEHHRYPGEHWSRLPRRRLAGASVSLFPPVLRWLEGRLLNRLQGTFLVWLERLALRPGAIQRFMLRSHERALRALLPALPAAPAQVGIIGGGLFPRTALLLSRLLPQAQLTVIEGDEGHLALAGRQLSQAGVPAARLRLLHERFAADRHHGFHLLVVPLGYCGDRSIFYERSLGCAVFVHDWIWRRRGAGGVVVSTWLLKRLNLVLR